MNKKIKIGGFMVLPLLPFALVSCGSSTAEKIEVITGVMSIPVSQETIDNAIAKLSVEGVSDQEKVNSLSGPFSKITMDNINKFVINLDEPNKIKLVAAKGFVFENDKKELTTEVSTEKVTFEIVVKEGYNLAQFNLLLASYGTWNASDKAAAANKIFLDALNKDIFDGIEQGHFNFIDFSYGASFGIKLTINKPGTYQFPDKSAELIAEKPAEPAPL